MLPQSASRSLLAALLLFGLAVDVGAQEQPESKTESFQFNQPIPVVIRMSNRGVVQMMLLGINLDGISVMSPQGKTLEYSNKSFVSARSPDGSFFYNPAKERPAEVIQRLNKLQPQSATPNVNPGTGVPMATSPVATSPTGPGAHNQQPVASNTTTNPFPSTFPMPMPTTAHAQPSYQQPSTTTFPTSPMPTTHSQPMPTTTSPTTTSPTTSPMPTYPSTAHTAMPSNGTMPTQSGPHMQPPTPNMSNMNPTSSMNPTTFPSQSTQNIYLCSKCKQQNLINGTPVAGHRCTHCGVVWNEVVDENGRVTSSSPAARVGGAVSGIALVIGIIVAIVRKSQSA